MFYSEIEKKLGRFFKYYRKNHGIRFTQICGSKICGHSIYNKIECGKVKKICN